MCSTSQQSACIPRDNSRLLGALRHLRDLGNTLVLVEHDREIIESADHLIDFGPGSGQFGGTITASGPPKKVKAAAKSLTGQYLSGKAAIMVPTNRRPASAAAGVPAIVIRGARQNNLKDLDVRIPLGVVTVVTGVSGSGKSSLVEDILWKAAAKTLHRAGLTPGAHEAIEGLDRIDKVISVDQTPLGSTPNSTPATYSGVFDLIRELFAKLPEAKVRGYTSRRFSFNMAGGRCETCEGAGQKRIEMHFLPDVWITCDACGGSRFTPEVLAVKFHGKTIADVLDMSVDGALELFGSVPRIRRILQTLHDVGLGYIPLGQAAPTLSGGEAQRVKLAAELSRPDTGKTLYILDEPTTGLHLDDVKKLLEVVHRLADLGNTVVVIEHNLEVIKTADWVLDLGPEAGAGGGELVAEGPPDEVARNPRSHTAKFLQGLLATGPFAERPRFDPKAAARKALEAAKSSNDKVQPRTVEKEARKGRRRPSRRPSLLLQPRPPGRSMAVSGIPAIASPATAAPRAGTAGFSSSSSIASRSWVPAASPRPNGPSAAWCGSTAPRGRKKQLSLLPRDNLGRVGRHPPLLCPPQHVQAGHAGKRPRARRLP